MGLFTKHWSTLMIALDEIFEALVELRRKPDTEFLEICESVARRFDVPQDFVEVCYDSLDGVRLDEDKWEPVILGEGSFRDGFWFEDDEE